MSEQLRDALGAGEVGPVAASARQEAGHVVGPRPQALVDRAPERARDTQVDEEPRSGEHERHHAREDERQAQPNGHPAQQPESALSR